MCLNRIEKFEPAKEGWKVYRNIAGKLYSLDQGEHKEILIGKWIDETYYRKCSRFTKFLRIFGIVDKITCNINEKYEYEMGFHTFHELDGAKYWSRRDRRCYLLGSVVGPTNPHCSEAIMKVLVKEPVVTGYQSGFKVTVSRKIKVKFQEDSGNYL